MKFNGHHSQPTRVGLNDEWLTPPHVLEAFGPFDLDPCAPIERPWPTAARHLTIADDGLSQPWEGRVWLNPPYGAEAGKWLARLAEHGNGIALIFARTETRTFFEQVWGKADALLFLAGRIHFHNIKGERAPMNAGAPSVLVAYGLDNVVSLDNCGLGGTFVENWEVKPNS